MGITRTGIDTQGGYSKEVHEFIKGKQPRVIGLEGKKNKDKDRFGRIIN